MVNKIKFSLLLIIFAYIFSFTINEISFLNDTSLVSTSNYEVTDESYFTFSYDDTNRTVAISYDVSKTFTSNVLVLPSTTTKDGITYNITSITFGGFYACLYIEEVVISENIEIINQNAFRGCTNLKKITFNTSVLKEIGDSAFASCTSLSSLILPEGLQTISSFAFDGCSSVEVAYLPATLNYIDLGTFTGCSNLKAIYINSLISFANVNVFDATNCPVIVSKDNIEYYQDSNKFNKYENVTYIVDVEINYNGGTDSNGETSGVVHKLFGFTFDYFVDEETGVWNKTEESIYSNLPSGLKLFKENQEFRLASYSYNDVEIYSELKVDQVLFETGIEATYEGVFKTSFENGVHTIEGISKSFITGEFLEINIPTIYWDGENKGNVKGIAENAFKDLNFLSFTFEEGIEFIGANAFNNVDIRNAIVIPQSVSFIGDYAFDSAACTPGYIYLNEGSSYGSNVFNNVPVVIVAPNEEIYEEINSTINNSNLTYLISITFDYSEGSYNNESSLTLTRLSEKELSYVQQSDLSWAIDHNFNLPTPTKQDYLLTSFECDGIEINRASVFSSDSIVNSIYILQYVRTNSTSNINASIYFAEGISINSTLSITSSSDYILSGSTTNLDIYGMYSIELLVDGVVYEASSYNINILLPEDMGVVENYAIYMMEGDRLVQVIGEYNDGYITFNLSSLNDIALANEELILSISFNEGILTAILVLALINIIEFCLIFNLNRGKRKAVVTYSSVFPLIILSANANNLSLIILLALGVIAVLQGTYIMYLFATRNNTFNVQQQVDSIAANIMPSLEDLENIINESRKTIEELNEEYLALEEPRKMVRIDDFDDYEDVDNGEDDDESDEAEEEVRTRLNATGQMVLIRFKKSFSARLNLTDEINKDYHTMVKNKLLEYKKVNCRISWNHEAYNLGRNQAAKINVRGKTLFLYLPLNPNDYIDSKISFKDCSYIKKYEQLPFRLKIKSRKGLQNAFELIELVMSNFETSKKRKFEQVNYYQKNRGFEKLLQEGLIKEIISANEYNELKEINKTIEEEKDMVSNNMFILDTTLASEKERKAKTSAITVSHNEQKHTVLVKSQHQPFNPSITPISTDSAGVLVRPKHGVDSTELKTNVKYEYTAVKGFNFDNYRN